MNVGDRAAAHDGERRKVPPVWVRLVAGIAVSGALLFLALARVNLASLLEQVARANYGLLMAAVVCYFLDLALRSLRWSVLLRAKHWVSPVRLYPALTIGYMANNLLPARIGDLSRAYLVRRRDGISASTVFASVALERLIDGITVVLLLVLILPSIPHVAWFGNLVWGATGVFGLALLVCIFFVSVRRVWSKAFLRAIVVVPPSLRIRVIDVVDKFFQGLQVLRSAKHIVAIAMLSVLIWLLGAVTYILVAGAFDIRLSLAQAVAAICVVNLATAIPLAPASIGSFDLAAITIFTVLGLSPDVASGVALGLHAVLFFPPVLVGLIFLWREDLSLGQLYGDASDYSKASGSGGSTPVGVGTRPV